VTGASGPTGPSSDTAWTGSTDTGSTDPAAVPITPESVLGRLEAAFLQHVGLSTDEGAAAYQPLGSLVADLAKSDLLNVGGLGQLIHEAKSQAGLAKLDDNTKTSGTALNPDHHQDHKPILPPHHDGS
jgi:hypothetical protein